MSDTRCRTDAALERANPAPLVVGSSARRDFLRDAAGLIALGAAVAAAPARAQQAGYQELDAPLATRDPSRIEVLEFFWFGCPHCYRFEPTINAWAATRPDDVDFVREAPPLNPGWENHSRTFYAAEALGITDGLFDQVFHRIHEEGRGLRSPDEIGEFVASLALGTDADTFVSTMRSFTVETALRRSVKLSQQARISGVPSLLINGRYVTSASLAGGNLQMVQVVDELIRRERA